MATFHETSAETSERRITSAQIWVVPIRGRHEEPLLLDTGMIKEDDHHLLQVT